MHLASVMGHTTIICMLKDWGADVNIKDHHGLTPMHFAAANGQTDAIFSLSELGADVNIKIKRNCRFTQIHPYAESGDTPVCIAAEKGQVTAIQVLFKLGANVHTANLIGNPPAYTASLRGHMDVIKLLVELGVDVNTTGMNGETLVHAVSYNNHVNIIKFLADQPYVHKTLGQRWLSLQCILLLPIKSSGTENLIKFLVDLGADVDTQDEIGRSPLFAPATNGQVNKISLYLVESG